MVRRNTITGDTVGYNTLGYLTWASNAGGGPTESYRYDALGMRRYAATYGSGPSQALYTFLANSERLNFAYHQQSPYPDTTFYTDGTDGARATEKRVHPVPIGCCPPTIHFENRTSTHLYTTDRKLREVFYQLDTTPAPPNLNYKVYRRTETYRYDALGRRVWQQMIRDTALNSCFDHDRSSGCRNEVTRTVWDGDQLLYELRAPADTVGLGSENDNASGVQNGRVGYTQAQGIDAPLALFKGTDVVVLYTDWRGRFAKGTCPATACTADFPYFPTQNMYQDIVPLTDGPPSWYGSLLGEMRDGSGYQYKRNRYYDPVAGRFTQEDPIGLSGGANLYGFANSDPVSFSDPFGLCPPYDRNTADCPAEVQRLLSTDRPIEDVSFGTFVAVSGVIGVLRSGIAAAGRAVFGRATGAVAEVAVEPSAGMLRQFSRQLAAEGRGSVEKSIRTLERRLHEHLSKLGNIKTRGGDPGSVEREISNFRRQIEAARRTLEKQ